MPGQPDDAVKIPRVNTYDISTDPSRLDLEAIHAYLARSYWSPGIPKALVARAIANSLCFGVYRDGAQVGFARVITDRASFAYLADVYVLEAHRGQGVSKRLVAEVLAHPDLQGLRRFLLATADAHGLYAQFGFRELARPGNMMELRTTWPHGEAARPSPRPLRD
jgi:N-acetylglutamate synthase-like GNAT family acetyltransferase